MSDFRHDFSRSEFTSTQDTLDLGKAILIKPVLQKRIIKRMKVENWKEVWTDHYGRPPWWKVKYWLDWIVGFFFPILLPLEWKGHTMHRVLDPDQPFKIIDVGEEWFDMTMEEV